jgi:hypothetical protein
LFLVKRFDGDRGNGRGIRFATGSRAIRAGRLPGRFSPTYNRAALSSEITLGKLDQP